MNANIEKLETFLTDLDYNFDVIALSETWNPISKDETLTNALPGYHPYIGNKGSATKGGCGLYVNDSLNFKPRKDLNVRSYDTTHELETCWIEVINNKEPNTIIGIVYRQPTK